MELKDAIAMIDDAMLGAVIAPEWSVVKRELEAARQTLGNWSQLLTILTVAAVRPRGGGFADMFGNLHPTGIDAINANIDRVNEDAKGAGIALERVVRDAVAAPKADLPNDAH